MEKKGFHFYWEKIEIPVYVLIAWSVVALLLQMYGGEAAAKVLQYTGWIVYLAIFMYIGYDIKKNHKDTSAPKAGALTGAISGLVGAVLGILIYYIAPGFYEAQVAAAAGTPGVSADMIQKIPALPTHLTYYVPAQKSLLAGSAATLLTQWLKELS